MQNYEASSVTPFVEITEINMWQLNYHNRPDFLDYFEDEQDYVDAMFILIVYQNFGILLRQDMLMQDWEPTGDHRGVAE